NKSVVVNAATECQLQSVHECPMPQAGQKSKVEPLRPTSIPQQLPRLIAIKYLSDYRVVRAEDGDSSDQDSDYGCTEKRDECTDGLPIENKTGFSYPLEWSACKSAMDLFCPDPPANIRFGTKARREIRALKAAQ